RFGISLLVKDVEHNKLAMMKAIDVSGLGAGARGEMLQELRRLAQLRHPHLAPIGECFLHSGKLCMVMDYFSGGNLAAQVAAREFSSERVLLWFTQALLAVSYLHSRDALHRDLRTRRLLLTRSGLVVVSGVALSAVLRGSLPERPDVEALHYSAPELLLNYEAHSFATDMWALGVILYELLAQRLPWEHSHPGKLRESICQRPLRPLPARHADLAPLCYSLLNASSSYIQPYISAQLHPAGRAPPRERGGGLAAELRAVQGGFTSQVRGRGRLQLGDRLPSALLEFRGHTEALHQPRAKRDRRSLSAGSREARAQSGRLKLGPLAPDAFPSQRLSGISGAKWAKLQKSVHGIGQSLMGIPHASSDCLPELCSAKGRPIYDTLRRLVVDSVRSGALELSVLRLNFNPSRSFQQVYKVGPRLGNGSFGSVHLCKRRATGEVRAVKMLLKAYTKEFVANEIEILTRLDHPNVLRFYEFFEDSRSVLAVMEYCDGGDFSTLVPKKGSEEVRVLYRDVMLGLAYCHNFGIVHRDLKFNNCVLVHGPHRAAAKIIDFGLSAIRRADEEDTDFLREVQGTGGFVAPEVMSGHYGAKCDIWSFGIMVFMQLTQGTHPFGYDGRMDHTRLMHRIATQEPIIFSTTRAGSWWSSCW
ncbi:unnamed protein product, partial [Effrenium voratum]